MNALALISVLALTGGQGHGLKPAEAMKSVAFMAGDWKGTQTFNTGGDPMVGAVTDHVEQAVGGRFVYEHLSTTLPGSPPTDTRHMLCYDPATSKFVAYWFNDTSALPMQLTGAMDGNKLVLLTTPAKEGAPVLRATYENISDNALGFTFEMKQGDSWRLLFHSDYKK
jgi:hypothetical protein